MNYTGTVVVGHRGLSPFPAEFFSPLLLPGWWGRQTPSAFLLRWNIPAREYGNGESPLREFAKSFYSSTAWRKCRAGYAKSRAYLCERCLAKGLYVPGEIVHHKVWLTPDNINNPKISLSWDNLQLVCRNCHAEIHEAVPKRYQVDEFGRVYL